MNPRNFILDVWADLKAEKLWPVAVLLLVAIVAVPMLLIKPAEEVAPAPPAPAAAAVGAEANGPKAVLAALNSKPLVRVSSLDQFRSKNPFKPLESLKELEDAAGVEAETTDPSGAEGGGAVGESVGEGGSTDGGSTDGGGGGTDEGTDGGGGTGEGDGGQTEPAQKYTYVLDLSFGPTGKTKNYKTFTRLRMLPSEADPLLVFLGVEEGGTKAVFLVDAGLESSGENTEGTCKPDGKECGFLEIEAGQVHTFANADGRHFQLTIDQIRKVKVEDAEKASAAVERKKRVRARTSVGKAAAPVFRRFEFPLFFSDLETGQ